ncbi:MAG: type IX secretion system protein PorQ [Bacteroidota bacterium]|jgi:hypothetical protein
MCNNRSLNPFTIMMKMKLFAFCFFSLALSFAQPGGEGVYKFLDLPVPSRTSALGGNTISLKDDDITLSFQNPALLTQSCSNQVAMAFVDYFADIKYGYGAYSRSFNKIGNFGAAMHYVNYGNFTSADEYGKINGTFSAADYSFNLSYCREIDSTVTFGTTLKTIYSKYERYSSIGNALDIGATYHSFKNGLTCALLLKNIGYQWRSYSQNITESLDFTSQISISKKMKKAPFRINLAYQFLEKWDLTYTNPENPEQTVDPFTGEEIKEKKFNKFMDKLGRHIVASSEILISKNFNLRIGYNYMRAADMKLNDRRGWGGLTFGFGFKVYKFHISYARANYHAAGGSNHFTLSARLNEFTKSKD